MEDLQFLNDFNDAWSGAAEQGGGGEYKDVPDGDYDAIVDEVMFHESKAGGKFLKWKLKITGPDHKGRLLWRYSSLTKPDMLGWLKHDLRMCGVVLEKLSDLPPQLENLLDAPVQIAVKASKKPDGMASVYINGGEREVPRDGEPLKPPDAGDDLPF